MINRWTITGAIGLFLWLVTIPTLVAAAPAGNWVSQLAHLGGFILGAGLIFTAFTNIFRIPPPN